MTSITLLVHRRFLCRCAFASLPLFACHDRTNKGSSSEDTSFDDTAAELSSPLLVPAPALLEAREGSYTLDADTRILASEGAEDVAALLAQALRPSTGLPLEVVEDDGGSGLLLALDPDLDLPAEGYTLDVDGSGAVLAAKDRAGLFYACQTLRQLLPPASLSASEVSGVAWTLPSVHIEDAPRFAYRGLMIDVARHFFGVEDIERQIDLMALHKLNRLHLHLTDDQGWRIEIKSWPLLTEVGGSTEVGGGPGGFYTQEEYAEIVAYAAARSITVIPEIDFPGHANAALASYAELNASGVAEPLYTDEGVISTPLWLEDDVTWAFVAEVWEELAAITPGDTVHVGGDEAIDISDEDYAVFIAWLQDTVAGQGKVTSGWDELGWVPLDVPFVAQWWISEDRTLQAADQGAGIVASPATHAYLDMKNDLDDPTGQVWAGIVDLSRAYRWDPVPAGVDEADTLGVEGALWTELVEDTVQMDARLWPRLAALAEVGWTPKEVSSWSSFQTRVGWHGARLEALGVGYYPSEEVVWVALADTEGL